MPNVTPKSQNNFSFCTAFSRWGRKIILSPQHGFWEQGSGEVENHFWIFFCIFMTLCLKSDFPYSGKLGAMVKKPHIWITAAHTETRKFNDETLKELCEELSQLDLTDSQRDCFVWWHSASQHPSSRMINGTAPVPDRAKTSCLLACIYSKDLSKTRAQN